MATRTELLARLTTSRAQLDIAQTTYTELLSKQNKNYMFTSGEGSQQASKVRLKDLREEIEWLRQDIEDLEQKLYGGGIVRFYTSRLK